MCRSRRSPADLVRRSVSAAALLTLGLTLAGGPVAAAEGQPEAAPAVAPAAAPKTQPGKAASEDEKALRQRATEYWEARVARSEKTADFYPPPEKGGPPVRKADRGNIRFSSFEIEKIAIDGDRALVQVKAKALYGTGEAAIISQSKFAQEALLAPTITDEWKKIDGVWYKKPIRRGLSRFMHKGAPGERFEKRRQQANAPAATTSAQGGADQQMAKPAETGKTGAAQP